MTNLKIVKRFLVYSIAVTIISPVLMNAPASAQLNIQSNPVFSTPLPKEQKLGPKPKPFEGTVTFDETAPKDKEINLGDIEFEGNHYYNDWTVKRYLKPLRKQQGELLNREKLEAAIADINKTSKFKVKATLSEGDASGETDVHLDVYEKQPWQVSLTADNQGRPGVGMYRGGLQVVNDSLLGFGDTLKVQYTGAARSHRVMADYILPVNRRGGKLLFKYIHQALNYDKRLIAGNPRQIGKDNAWVLKYIQPLDKKKHWTAWTGFLWRHATLDRADTRILKADPRPWMLGLKYQKPDKWGKTQLGAASIVGSDWFGGDSKFWRAKLNAKRVFKLPKKQKVVLRALAQFSPDPMPPVQQFPIGGVYTVRGYTEGLFNGDQGHWYSAEYHTPIPLLSKVLPWVADHTRLVGFVDFGQTWQDASGGRFRPGVSNDSKMTTLLSTGFGLRYRLSQYLQGFVDAGWGLGNPNAPEINNRPTARVHFGIRSTLLKKPWKKRTGGLETISKT